MGCSLARQPVFSAYAHARAKVGGGGKEKYANARAKVAEGRIRECACESGRGAGGKEKYAHAHTRKNTAARETTKFYRAHLVLTKFSGK